MKITITGPSGFIAKNLIPKLKGHKVTLFDGDVSLGWGVLDKTDLIIHLASLNKTGDSIERPYEYFKVNVTGTINMLMEARKLKAKFMYLGTIKQNENNPYGVSKRNAMDWIKCYQETYDIDTIINMVGNVYGPYGDHLFVNQFIQKAVYGEPVVVFGDGEELRCILHVDDLTDFMVHQINNFDDYKGVTPISGGVDNVVSIKELIDFIKPEKVEYKPAIKGQGKVSINTTTPMTKLIPWKEGVGDLIKHYANGN